VTLATSASLLSACSTDQHPSPCDLGTAQHALQSEDRKVIGYAAEYPADGTMRGREAELAQDQAARRQVAWQTIAKVLAPVPIAADVPAMTDPTIPRWHTWYGEADVDRMFLRMYEDLGVDGRAARERFSADALDEAFEWNTTSVDEQPEWTEKRWLDYLDAIDDGVDLAGIGGIGRVAYDGPATRHLLASYPEIVACMADGAPEPFVDGPPTGPRTLYEDSPSLDACSQRTYGPFFVAGGASLSANVVTDGYIELVIRDADGEVACRDEGEHECSVDGPGPFTVDVIAGDEATVAALTVEYSESNPAWAACLDGAFNLDAVIVKADWRRAQFDFQLPVYDTSADALGRVLDSDMPDWGPGDRELDPQADDIYTLLLPTGNRYRLAALHIMSKELDHWQWVTLWWSDTPDADFGADRPADIASLPGPWRNYKMCTATMFDERDSRPDGGYASTAPTLAASLSAVHGGIGSPSWCSNPYLEAGPGNADTNCIGCHQHGGTGLSSETIIGDPLSFPAHGRTWLRNNFPHDYTFAVDDGDRLGRNFLDVIEWYETFE
jgi:hypothetical protein